MKPSRLTAIEHVEIEAPLGIEPALRWFFGEVCGLEEITGTYPSGVQLLFRSARLELRIRCVDRPQVDSVNRRMTIAVSSLREAAERLDEQGVE